MSVDTTGSDRGAQRFQIISLHNEVQVMGGGFDFSREGEIWQFDSDDRWSSMLAARPLVVSRMDARFPTLVIRDSVDGEMRMPERR